MNEFRSSIRKRLLMDPAWRFHLGDDVTPPVRGHLPTYFATKAGGAAGAAAPDFDDTAWRTVDLPHDWQVEMEFDPGANANHGYKQRGIAWYRRKFRLDEEDRGKWLALVFDGVATHCAVWLNGTLLQRNFCGYTPFAAEISAVANYGAEPNTLAVRVDADAFEGWWYEGAGIYRHVWLVEADPIHIAPWGVWANPVPLDDSRWESRIETTVENTGHEGEDVVVKAMIVAPDGAEVESISIPVNIPPGRTTVINQTIPVEDPALWSLETPVLYRLHTEIFRGDVAVDNEETVFGFRTIRFDPERGFFLNGQSVKLKGTCNHQDHAGVGAALPDSLHEFRIRRLKEMGSNAYRCSHHLPATELLDACDHLGMLVMDENRNFNPAPETMAQLRTMVLRDRNHPSVILWSIFNEEIYTQGKETGRRLAAPMIGLIKELDPSRPVTAAICTDFDAEAGVADLLDVMGINYSHGVYETFHAAHPGLPVVSAENNCALSTRGVYRTDPAACQFASYDREHTEFGDTARRSWREIETRPFVAGGFLWTGFDYRGEPYPYEWPCISTNLGNLDTCGFAKDGFHLHQAFWTEKPMIHVLPHWTWPGREGEPMEVMCITNCDEVELFLNGRSMGRRPVDRYEQVCWPVPYEPGELRAVGWKNGHRTAEDRVETASEFAALCLEPDRPWLRADGEDAVPVTVRAVDANGRFVPTAHHRIQFNCEGSGKIIGVGNGDPACHEPDKGTSRSLFNGLCQVIVQAGTEPGEVVLTATAPGFETCQIVLEARSAPRRTFIAPVG